MRMIERTTRFRRDYKRELKGPHASDLNASMRAVLEFLIEDAALPARYRDHALVADWRGYRECHIKPDLLLIYEKQGTDLLLLVRLGSHSELFS